MYSLIVNFNTVEELHSFVSGKVEVKPAPTVGDVEVKPAQATAESFQCSIPPVIEEKKPAKKASKKAAPVEVELATEFEKVESPFKEQMPVFDREGAIVTAQTLVAQLKATGIADDKLMPAIHEVYGAAGCPIQLKISQLDDEQLSTFIPLFELKVKSIVVNAKAAQSPSSFI